MWQQRIVLAKKLIADDVQARHHDSEFLRERLPVILDQIGFRVEQVDMAGSTVHEQPDDPLRAGRMVRRRSRERTTGGHRFAGRRSDTR